MRLNDIAILVVLGLFGVASIVSFILVQGDPRKAADGVDPTFPVDCIITWVDSNDAEWKQQYLKHANQNKTDDLESSRRMPPTTSLVHDELYYNIRGVQDNMPWVNSIIVASAPGHVPTYLPELQARAPLIPIRVVHHQEFIPTTYLPTFSAPCIEMWLHHIPGLSEHFIYLNDDFFIANPIPKRAFFTRGGRRVQDQTTITRDIERGPRSKQAKDSTEMWWVQLWNTRQELGIGNRPMYFPDHVVYNWTRTLGDHILRTFPQAVHTTCSSKIRDFNGTLMLLFFANVAPDQTHFVDKYPYTRSFGNNGDVPPKADMMVFNNLGDHLPKKVVQRAFEALADIFIPKSEKLRFKLFERRK